ncbi:MAG: hypothetical protein MRZ79_06180 [Bacteroidia bacterium]|nr:hypothetical protein [Bacteroidia bacterium]
MKKYKLLLAIFLLAGFSSCQLNPFRDVSWNVDLEAPLAFTQVGIWDVISDSSFFEEGSDNKLSIVYRDTVINLQIADLVEIPDTTNSFLFTLDPLELDSDTIRERLTLGAFARDLAQSSDPNTAQIGNLILANQGNTLPFVPEFTGQATDTINIDASEFFESALLESGDLVIEIENQFPLGLSNVIFRISNANLGTDIVRDTFPSIPSRSTVSETYDMAGQQIESSLAGQLENLDVDAGFLVPIDTNDYIEIRLVAQNLKPVEATAIFPGQTIFDTLVERIYNFPGELAELSLTKLVVRSGQIRAVATSSVEDSIGFTYELPKAVDASGATPSVFVKVPPAPVGGTVSTTEVFQLGGFTLDLTGEENSFNTLTEKISVDLIFSGNLVSLNQNDSVNVDFSLESLDPIYVEGYIGRTAVTFEGRELIDLFDELDVSKIKFSEAEASISFANSIGVPSEVLVEEFSALNTNSGSRVKLANSNLVAGPLKIASPLLPDTNEVKITSLDLTADNSNINPFISSLANEVSYNLTLMTNPDGEFSLDNFITENSSMDVVLDFKLPMVGVVDRLVIRDTTDFSSEAINLDDISSGGLNLVVENDFPLELTITAKVLDENMQLIETLADGAIIEAAMVDENGRLSQAATSRLSKAFTIEKLNELLEDGRMIVFDFILNTKPDGEAVGLYTDYGVRAKLVGNFEYKISN